MPSEKVAGIASFDTWAMLRNATLSIIKGNIRTHVTALRMADGQGYLVDING